MFRAIIVDDEFKARENLRILLQEFCENIEVVGTADDIDQALDLIAQVRPDVLFLDIQLHNQSGFDLLEKIKTIDFKIIFVTAFAEHAIKAFKFAAVDYILKPIDIQDLQLAVQKVVNQHTNQYVSTIETLIRNFKTSTKENSKLALPTATGLYFIGVSDIVYLEANGNYTQFFLKNNSKYMVSKTLKEYEELLEESDFFRIHNSYLINLKEIKRYIKGEGGQVVMQNDVTLDVSKRRKEAFLAKILLL